MIFLFCALAHVWAWITGGDACVEEPSGQHPGVCMVCGRKL